MSAYDELLNTVLGRLANRDLKADDDHGLRQLIEDEIDGYQRGAYSESVGDPLTDPEAVRDRLFRSIRGSGPLDAALARRDIREIRGVDDDLQCVLTDGTVEAIDEPTSPREVLEAVRRLVAGVAVLDEAHPGVGGLRIFLPDGRQARLSVSIYPRIDGLVSFVLRVFQHSNLNLDDLVRFGSVTRPAANLVQLCAMTKSGVLIAGPPGAGKSTMANIMIRAGGDIRTLVLEEMRELSAPLIDGDKWAISPAEDMNKLVREALTYSPERCVLGEFKGPEAWALTRLANLGIGLWIAVHSNSAAEAIKALAWAAKASPEAVGLTVFELEQRFAELLEVIIYVDIESTYSAKANRRQPLQRVTEIAVRSEELSAHGLSLQPIFTRDGDIEAPLRWTEAELPATLQKKFDDVLRHHGMRTIDILRGTPVQL